MQFYYANAYAKCTSIRNSNTGDLPTLMSPYRQAKIHSASASFESVKRDAGTFNLSVASPPCVPLAPHPFILLSGPQRHLGTSVEALRGYKDHSSPTHPQNCTPHSQKCLKQHLGSSCSSLAAPRFLDHSQILSVLTSTPGRPIQK